jgi:hypothetical protein
MAIRGLETLDNKMLDGLVFCATAYSILDEVRSSPKGIEELRLRRGQRAKKLVEEILPLATFVQARYGPGYRLRIRWLGGNQSYDARLRCSGAVVDRMGIPRNQYLEVTTAVHQTEHLVRERINTEGFSFAAVGNRRDQATRKIISVPVVHEHSTHLGDLAALVKARVADKASKLRHPAQTSLLVQCELGVVVLEEEWDEIIQALRAELQTEPNRFREVVLVEVGKRIATLSRQVGRAQRPKRV